MYLLKRTTQSEKIMNIKAYFVEACVNSNSLEELHQTIGSDDLGYCHEQDVKNGWEGLSFSDWREAIQESITLVTMNENL